MHHFWGVPSSVVYTMPGWVNHFWGTPCLVGWTIFGVDLLCPTTSLILRLPSSCDSICSNVPPCVAREPPCRDESIVQASQVSPSRVYEVMVNVPFFSAIFIEETSVQREKYRGLDHAVDRFVRSVDRRFSCPPAPSRPFTCFRISEPCYDSPIKKEYVSKL